MTATGSEDSWCTSCGIHRAQTTSPLCPVCTEDEPEQKPEPAPLSAAIAVLNGRTAALTAWLVKRRPPQRPSEPLCHTLGLSGHPRRGPRPPTGRSVAITGTLDQTEDTQ